MAKETKKKLSAEEMEAKLAQLEAENEELKAKSSKDFKLKVGKKGNVSVYGLGQRWPVSLYRGQWELLLSKKDDILAFIEANKKDLSVKE